MAIFELNDASEVDTAWFIGSPEFDWMALVYRDGPTAPWRMTCRFRYIVDEKDPWESNDLKRAIQTKNTDATEATRKRLVEGTDKIAALITPDATVSHRFEIKGSSDDFLKVWAQQPWAHTKVSPKMPEQVQ